MSERRPGESERDFVRRRCREAHADTRDIDIRFPTDDDDDESEYDDDDDE